MLFAHNEVVIKAPCATVWQHLIEAQNWPAWYPNAQDVKIANDHSGALQQNSIFEWITFGLPITSIVYEYVPNSRLAWFGKSEGLDAVFYHTWYLVPTSDGCQMITEEVVQGPGAVAFRDKDPSAMHRGLVEWLETGLGKSCPVGTSSCSSGRDLPLRVEKLRRAARRRCAMARPSH